MYGVTVMDINALPPQLINDTLRLVARYGQDEGRYVKSVIADMILVAFGELHAAIRLHYNQKHNKNFELHHAPALVHLFSMVAQAVDRKHPLCVFCNIDKDNTVIITARGLGGAAVNLPIYIRDLLGVADTVEIKRADYPLKQVFGFRYK